MKALSGKFVIRMPSSLHELLKKESQRKKESLNSCCIEILKEGLRPSSTIPSFDFLPTSLFSRIIKQWEGELRGIVLFGSAVREELRASSDIDLLFVLKDSVSLDRSIYIQWEEFYRKESENIRRTWEISPHFVYLPVEVAQGGGLWYEVALEGKILWEKDNAVSSFLRKIRFAMIQGQIQRSFSHGHPYWIKINL